CMGALTCVLCMFRLADLVAALVVIRIMMQFILQALGVMIFRGRDPSHERPFRMWLYPLPALLALAGFVYILLMRENFERQVLLLPGDGEHSRRLQDSDSGTHVRRAVEAHW